MTRHEPLEYLLVAAQACQRDHRRQPLPDTARVRQPGLARRDAEPRHRLLPIVEDIEQRTVLLGVVLVEEPPHTDDRCHRPLERTIGELPCEADGLADPHGEMAAAAAALPGDRGSAVDAVSCQTGARPPDSPIKCVQHREPVPGNLVMTRWQKRLQAAA